MLTTGLMFARDRREAERMLELIEIYGQDYGLRINRAKNVCMVFNVGEGEQEDRLGGVEVVQNMKYLGVEVEARRDCFGGNSRKKIGLAEKMANVTYSMIAKACERNDDWKGILEKCGVTKCVELGEGDSLEEGER